MSKKHFISFILFLGLAVLVLYSCNQPTVVENKAVSNNSLLKQTKKEAKIIGYKTITENGKEKKVPIYDGDPNDSNGIKSLSCNVYTTYVYEFDHYEHKGNKNLGIWDLKKYKTASELHNTWGFNGYFVTNESQKNSAVNVGYDPDVIMVNIAVTGTHSQHTITIPSGTFSNYYLDEPLERGILTQNDVFSISNAISNINPNANLFMGSYKDDNSTKNWYQTILQNTSNTRMMCDQYYDYTPFCGHDQSGMWTWFKNNYGSSKVKSHWMNMFIDGEQNDFGLLFNKANSLGINTLWVFTNDKTSGFCTSSAQLTETLYNSYLDDVTREAFNKGWLRKFAKKYKYLYKCPEYHSDPCWCQKHDDGWELYQIQYMGLVEVYP